LLLYEEGITGKWLAMLKEIAPGLSRAALIANPKRTPYDYFVRSAKSVAPSLAIELAAPVADTPVSASTAAGASRYFIACALGRISLFRHSSGSPLAWFAV
jgi:putative ABC transport system substrate-binding protein